MIDTSLHSILRAISCKNPSFGYPSVENPSLCTQARSTRAHIYGRLIMGQRTSSVFAENIQKLHEMQDSKKTLSVMHSNQTQVSYTDFISKICRKMRLRKLSVIKGGSLKKGGLKKPYFQVSVCTRYLEYLRRSVLVRSLINVSCKVAHMFFSLNSSAQRSVSFTDPKTDFTLLVWCLMRLSAFRGVVIRRVI